MSNPKPRHFWLGYHKSNPKALSGIFSSPPPERMSYGSLHVIEATPRTLAADEMYEALEEAVNLLEHHVRPDWEQTKFRNVLAKARGGK